MEVRVEKIYVEGMEIFALFRCFVSGFVVFLGKQECPGFTFISISTRVKKNIRDINLCRILTLNNNHQLFY